MHHAGVHGVDGALYALAIEAVDDARLRLLFIEEPVAAAPVQQLRRLSKPESWHRGFADALAAYLEGYFAEVEPTVPRERLAREVAENALSEQVCVVRLVGRALLTGRCLRAVRPWHFFRRDGRCPKRSSCGSRSLRSSGRRLRCSRNCGGA
jgi:hypothetical protein